MKGKIITDNEGQKLTVDSIDELGNGHFKVTGFESGGYGEAHFDINMLHLFNKNGTLEGSLELSAGLKRRITE